MTRLEPIKTLGSGRIFLRRIHLYNRPEFSIASIGIPIYVGNILLWLPSAYVTLAVCWRFLEEFDLIEMSLSVASTIMTFSTILGYSTLGIKMSIISETVEHLQSFVEKSKASSIPFSIQKSMLLTSVCAFQDAIIHTILRKFMTRPKKSTFPYLRV